MKPQLQCEAICETGRKGKHEPFVRGEQCTLVAGYVHVTKNGVAHGVCWTHLKKAAEARRVTFVRRQP